jgi:hypothetical protein
LSHSNADNHDAINGDEDLTMSLDQGEHDCHQQVDVQSRNTYQGNPSRRDTSSNTLINLRSAGTRFSSNLNNQSFPAINGHNLQQNILEPAMNTQPHSVAVVVATDTGSWYNPRTQPQEHFNCQLNNVGEGYSMDVSTSLGEPSDFMDAMGLPAGWFEFDPGWISYSNGIQESPRTAPQDGSIATRGSQRSRSESPFRPSLPNVPEGERGDCAISDYCKFKSLWWNRAYIQAAPY